MKIFVTCSLLFLMASSLGAQIEDWSSKKNIGIRIDIGLDYLQSSNRHLSFVNSSGAVLQSNLSFEAMKNKSYVNLLLRFRNGELESNYNHYSPQYTEYYAEITYAGRIWQKSKWKVMAGPAFSVNLWLQQYNFADLTDVISLAPSINLDLYSRITYQINHKSTIIWAPTFGLIARICLQPYSSYDEFWVSNLENYVLFKNSEFKSMPDVFRFNSTLSYERALSKRFDYRFSIVSNHSKIKSNKTIAFQSFGIQTSLKFKF